MTLFLFIDSVAWRQKLWKEESCKKGGQNDKTNKKHNFPELNESINIWLISICLLKKFITISHNSTVCNTWHFSCEAQLLAMNYCNLHLPWSNFLPLAVTIHIFQQLAYFGCFPIFSIRRLFTIGTLPRVYSWLSLYLFLRSNSSEYFKLSKK